MRRPKCPIHEVLAVCKTPTAYRKQKMPPTAKTKLHSVEALNSNLYTKELWIVLHKIICSGCFLLTASPQTENNNLT